MRKIQRISISIELYHFIKNKTMDKNIIENCDKLLNEGCNIILVGDGKEIDQDTYTSIVEISGTLIAAGYKVGMTNFLVDGTKFREKIT